MENPLDRSDVRRMKDEVLGLRRTLLNDSYDHAQQKHSLALRNLVLLKQSNSAFAKLQELSRESPCELEKEKCLVDGNKDPTSQNVKHVSSPELEKDIDESMYLNSRQPSLSPQLRESRAHNDVAWEKFMDLRKEILPENEKTSSQSTKIFLDLLVSRSKLAEKIEYKPPKYNRPETAVGNGDHCNYSFLNLSAKRTPFMDYRPRTKAFKSWEANLRERCSKSIGQPLVDVTETVTGKECFDGISDDDLEKLNQERENICKRHFASDWAKMF